MVSFDEQKMLVDQYGGHYGLQEIYVHYYASGFLFVASVICLFFIFKSYRAGKLNHFIPAAIFLTGLIGFGELAEHFTTTSFGHDFYHYLHLVSGSSAVFFLFIGLKKHIEKKNNTSLLLVLGMIVTGLFVSIGAASQSDIAWDVKIEIPFLFFTALPAFIISIIIICVEYKNIFTKPSSFVLYLSLIGASATILTLDIIAGRILDIIGLASGYVITHSLQDVFHVTTGAFILAFAFSAKGLATNNRW
jgi:hypothetical protein